MKNIVQYDKYKNSNIDWIGDIPEHWEVRKLKFQDHIIMGQSPDSKSYNDNYMGLPFLQGNAEFKALNPIPVIYSSEVSKSAFKDDILLSVRAPIGAVNIADQKYGIGRGLCAIRALNTLNDFLYYLMISIKEDLNSKGTGSTYLSVSISDVKNTFIPIPLLLEQRQIADFLDKKTALIDEFIFKKKRLIELLNKQKRGIITKAVTRGIDPKAKMKDSGIEWIGKIPEHWEVRKLKFLANIRMSNVDKKSYENQQEILLCNYVDVYKNNFITDNLSFMKATASKEEVRKFLLKNQDVIITKDSETADDIAVPALVTKDFDNVVCGYHLSLITTKDNVLLGKYLFRLFSHKIFNKQFSVFANGVTRYGLGAYYIYNAFISLPPLYEQYQITEYIETKLSKIDNVISKTEKEIELMEKYRKALISEVVTGKIKVINYEQNC